VRVAQAGAGDPAVVALRAEAVGLEHPGGDPFFPALYFASPALSCSMIVSL
jgi:hypothetical protein